MGEITLEQVAERLDALARLERDWNAQQAEFNAFILRFLNQQGAGFGETFDAKTMSVVKQHKG